MNRNYKLMYIYFLYLLKIQVIYELMIIRWNIDLDVPHHYFLIKRIYFWYFYNYLALLYFYFCDIYAFITISSRYFKKKSFSSLMFLFKKNKIYIILLNSLKQTLFLLTPGFYQQLLSKTKKFKRTKTLKLLMVRHLRKLLIALQVHRIWLISKYTPIFINEICFFLTKPLVAKFINPINLVEVDESTLPYYLNFLGLIFLKTISYSFRRLKKFHFLKRKIKRKLVFQNQLVD